ncbi:MAG: glycine--tRNA ligase subunit beta, partial [Fervidobacterium nodosum]
MSKPNEFLFELGIEELPTTEINGLIQQLSDKIQNTLSVEGINYEKFQIFVAPRRFGFVIEGLPDNTPEKVIEKKGPAANIAFDENNQPTKALLGFLKSNNSTLEEVKIVDNYVYITKTQNGLPIEDFLKVTVPSIITSLKFRKPMKWADGKYEFVRIPHHVLALLNGKIVEMEIFEIKSSNKTVGHRFVMDEYFEVNSVQDYFDKLSKYYVIPKLEDRIKFIKSQLEEFEKNGYTIDKDEELIQEVAILTEYPKLISGTF